MLRRLEKAARVPYEPDADAPVDRLYAYIHIAACYALQLIELEGFSEEARSTLEEAWHVSCWLEGPSEMLYCFSELVTEQDRSFTAVKGLLSIEMARVYSSDADYEKSLHFYAVALSYIPLKSSPLRLAFPNLHLGSLLP
jgi:hypothetical protein